MKGLILAGGTGSRLFPTTVVVSKQLLPIYDKPMIYYPLSVLIMSGITEILIITTPHDLDSFKRLLSDGSQWGISLEYVVQDKPEGLAQAFILGEEFIGEDSCALILGDNIFYGHTVGTSLLAAAKQTKGATIFTSHVNNPSDYGVVEIDSNGRAINIEEKPGNPRSNLAVTGLYFYDNRVVEIAKTIKPSPRGELEITDVNRRYMEMGELSVHQFGRGVAWLDTGTHDSMLEACQFVATLAHRQGLQIACIEEIAYSLGLIDKNRLLELAKKAGKSTYGKYLMKLAESE